jgi:serine/threonine-protein kinase
MDLPPTNGRDAPPLSTLERIDALCERFEQACRAGRRPRLEEYLVQPAGPEQGELFRELLFIERNYRRLAGERPRADEYLARFPAHAAIIRELLVEERDSPGEPSDEERATRILDQPVWSAAGLPEQFGRYRILRSLDQRGRHAAYLAHDTQLEREVVLEVPRPAAGDGRAAVRRFVRAARAAAAVQHPHLCPVLDSGEWHGTPFLTRPPLEGPTLEERLRDGPLPPREAAALAEKVARALQAAHDKGVLHRDLTPVCIRLTAAGEPVVTGFELARREGSGRETVAGQVLGTPGYLAPERLTGQIGADTPAADVYGLAAVLYEMLTGQPPFGRTIREVLVQAPAAKLVPPSQRQPKVPATLDAVCLKALSRSPADRHGSMTALADHLRQFLLGPAGDAEAAREPNSSQTRIGDALPSSPAPEAQPKSWDTPAVPGKRSDRLRPAREGPAPSPASGLLLTSTRRVRRRLAGFGFVLFILGAAVVAASRWYPRDSDESAPASESDPPGTVVVSLPMRGVIVRVDGREVKLDGEGRLARLSLPAGEHSVAVEHGGREVFRKAFRLQSGEEAPLIQATWPGAFPLDALDPKNIPAAERFAGQLPELVAVLGEQAGRHWGPIRSLAVSPDGRLVATGGDDQVIRLWDAETLQARGTLPGGGANALTFSADSRQLFSASINQPAIRVWDVAGQREVRTFTGHTAGIWSLSLSADGQRLLSGSLDKTARLWDVPSGKELEAARRVFPDAVERVQLCPKKSQALALVRNTHVVLWDPMTGKELRTLERAGNISGIQEAACSADGRLVYTAWQLKKPRQIEHLVWDAETGQVVQELVSSADVSRARFTPDGRVLFTAGGWGDYAPRAWSMANGQMLGLLEGPADSALAMDFDPSGERLYTAGSDGVWVWDVQDRRNLRPDRGHHGYVSDLAFSPDGRQLLSTGWHDLTVRLWDAVSGKMLQRQGWPGVSGAYKGPIRLALSPDGQQAVLGGTRDIQHFLVHWDVAGWRSLRETRLGHDTRALAHAHHKSLAVAGGGDGSLTWWDLKEGGPLQRHPDDASRPVLCVALSPDDRHAISGHEDGVAWLWDLGGLKVERRVKLPAAVSCAAFSLDGKQVALGLTSGELYRWQLDQEGAQRVPRSGPAEVRGLVWDAAGRGVFLADAAGRVVACDIATGRTTREIQLPGPVYQLALAPDGRHVATANANGTIFILRVQP